MNVVLDLHIHSKYSRSCSPNLTLRNISQTARLKGVDIIATGDFTHPQWFKNLQEELEEDNKSGLYFLKNKSFISTRFILATELSLVYKDGEKVRRVHLMVQAPNLLAVKELNKYLDRYFNIRSDGRPILKLPADRLVEICLKIHPQFLIYPAHIWTPWYAIFGSKSGFDSLEECFKAETSNIYAFETGLSSDPEMNWRLSGLDSLTTLSNSDAHSLQNIGREANVWSLETMSYSEIYRVIKERDLDVLKYTIEFYPEEGKYYLDGHRACNYSCLPEISLKNKGICPVCKKPLVLGVSYRINQLADRPLGFKPNKYQKFKKIIELDKIIAESLKIKSRNSKQVQKIYIEMIKALGSELKILLEREILDIENIFGRKIALGVKKVREGNVKIQAGFDGEYGRINIFNYRELKK